MSHLYPVYNPNSDLGASTVPCKSWRVSGLGFRVIGGYSSSGLYHTAAPADYHGATIALNPIVQFLLLASTIMSMGLRNNTIRLILTSCLTPSTRKLSNYGMTI